MTVEFWLSQEFDTPLPKQMGRYKISKLLGRGGMGVVYQAHDPGLNREVVVKLITAPDLANNDEWRQRFQREVQVGRLNHPHIITIHDVDLDHQPPYVVMELLRGGSLKERLRHKPIAWREALILLRPLAEALNYAHQAGVIHRDVKPANIMFAGDEANTLKLVDFGMARWQDTEQVTQTGVVLGTPAYMSPEQALGEAVNTQTDIFAFGVILFEAITGHNPLEKGTSVKTLIEATSNNKIDLSPMADQAPPEVIQLIEQAIAKDRNQRYLTCKALLADLNRCLNIPSGISAAEPVTVPDNYGEVSLSLPDPAMQSASRSQLLDIEPPYGTMRLDSKFYISRIADKHCREHLSRSYGTTLFIQAPRQMGKSSLMHRLLNQAGQEWHKSSAFIDFQKFPEHYFEDEEKFLTEFCLMIGEALGIPEAIDHYWSGRRTNIKKCSLYLSDYILPRIDKPLILALDEVERILTSPFRANFFGMLRTWHNDRATQGIIARMTLFLSSSTEPYLFVDNPNQSPFNVAEVITLQDFTREEVEELNRRHHSPLNSTQIEDLMTLLNGHPFLTRLALYQLVTRRIDWETLLVQATDDRGPFGDHLRYYLLRILQKPDLKQALVQICQSHAYEEDQIFHRLKGAGLIKRVESQIILRNNLYARYFEERLNVRNNKP